MAADCHIVLEEPPSRKKLWGGEKVVGRAARPRTTRPASRASASRPSAVVARSPFFVSSDSGSRALGDCSLVGAPLRCCVIVECLKIVCAFATRVERRPVDDAQLTARAARNSDTRRARPVIMSHKMSRRKQARPIRHLDDDDETEPEAAPADAEFGKCAPTLRRVNQKHPQAVFLSSPLSHNWWNGQVKTRKTPFKKQEKKWKERAHQSDSAAQATLVSYEMRRSAKASNASRSAIRLLKSGRFERGGTSKIWIERDIGRCPRSQIGQLQQTIHKWILRERHPSKSTTSTRSRSN